jgi:beta-glucosidase/6-phospho-beta-glucosidase/beta-galactosidase
MRRARTFSFPALACAVLAASLLPSCTSGGGIVDRGDAGADSVAPETFDFPKGFLFGTAIAGFQADMGCPSNPPGCIDPNSDWYQWVTDPSIVNDPAAHVKGEPVTNGPGFYELYPQDLDRAKNELKNGALRLSIEWSRIFPTSTVGIEDETALTAAASAENVAWYHQVFAAMKARGLVPLVTLNHYSLPTWIHDAVSCHANIDTCTARGWLDHDTIVHEIAKYAGFVAREFGGDVDLWATLNEPFTAVVVAGFLLPSATRSNPPGVMLRIPEAKQAALTMIDAHARMYDAVKANDTVSADPSRPPASVGLVYNLEAVAPSDPEEPADVEGAKNLSYLLNDVFLNACVFGDLDVNLDGKTVRRDDLAGRMDYIGINYYARLVAKGAASPFPALSPLLTVSVSTLTNQDYDYPRGVYEVLMHAKKWKVPLYITETGYQDPNDDGRAAAWLIRTLAYAKRAYDDGAPVQGYFWWTLMDNYEWNHGMAFHMGMYGVDPKDPTKARKPRKGAAMYGRIASSGSIPKDLIDLYPSAR